VRRLYALHVSLQELGGWESAEMVRRYAHLGANHLGANHLGANHLGANHLGANHLGANHLGANHLGANHLGANHLAPDADRLCALRAVETENHGTNTAQAEKRKGPTSL